MGVQLRLTEDALVVRLTGRDRACAWRQGLHLPMSRVLVARTMTRRDAVAASPRLHLPGLSLPGMLRSGSYGIGERRQLWAVHGAELLLAIYLRGEPYHRVVVEVDDPEELARAINDALPRRRLPP